MRRKKENKIKREKEIAQETSNEKKKKKKRKKRNKSNRRPLLSLPSKFEFFPITSRRYSSIAIDRYSETRNTWAILRETHLAEGGKTTLPRKKKRNEKREKAEKID